MKPSRVVACLLLAVVIASPYFNLPGWTSGLAVVVWFYALALLGLNLIFGVTGMLALGQAAFMALPVYGTGILDARGIPFPICVVAGLAGSLLIAKWMASVFVRLPGIFFAVGTLGFGYVVEGLARAFPSVSGGASGLVLEQGRLIGDNAWYGIAVVALIAGTVLYAALVRGAFWRQLRTIHHDELVAAAVGIDVVKMKERAFLIGSAYAIIAGLLKAYYVGVVIPEDAGVDRSTEQLSMVMVGGAGHLLGPALGASVLQWLFVITGYMRNYELLVYGTVFLATVLYARDGIAGWFSKLWHHLERLIDGKRSPERISRVAISTAPSPDKRERAGACLTVEGISKRFGGLQALDSVSFAVDFGEIFTVVGPNGAGKSTLFNVVSGIEKATSGSIQLNGRDITSLLVHQRAALIGRSFQVARLVPDLTVLENVMVRLDQISSDLSESQRANIALEQIDYFGLGNVAFRPIRELSLGQHKIIDLTRAAVGDPPLVLLDEPAVGLAREELDNLAELLAKLQARNSAVVIIEHNIDFVSLVAKRGIVLDNGRPIALGLTKQILEDPLVNEAYFGALQ